MHFSSFKYIRVSRKDVATYNFHNNKNAIHKYYRKAKRKAKAPYKKRQSKKKEGRKGEMKERRKDERMKGKNSFTYHHLFVLLLSFVHYWMS